MKLSDTQVERLRALTYEDYVDELPENEWEAHRTQLLSEVSDAYELHAFAENYNWDGGIEELEWVISNPLCDKATALMIYGLGSPSYYYRKEEKGKEFQEYEIADWAFLKSIERRISNGEFKEGKIAYDPSDFHGIEVFKINSANPGNKLVPEYMKVSTNGEAIENSTI
ncbi:DUF4274 domain-containing protein [Coraliomargarita sp. SDUM461003]|uniref:DUF4274 domain-containing protein n=1 Tax=Thalassobacterium maritimum TaxID=3041265 RepID=A0ABU1AZT4_9BACT|nr:DUF4274 domain-containing protein [Coraliomargarita sp. SDUM461003]MDQ8209671.1 DUF4274 domain-containing protein [Coraliomargarita sp. SDUM461003]